MTGTAGQDTLKDLIKGTAVIILIFSGAAFVPLLGLFCAMLIPLPVLVYRMQYGRKVGALVPVAAFAIMAGISSGFSPDLIFFGGQLILGYVLGDMLEKDISIEKTVCYTAASVLCAVTAGLIFVGNLSGVSLYEIVSGHLTKSLELSIMLYEKSGMPQENIRLISEAIPEIVYWLIRLMPAAMTALTLAAVWITLLLSRPVIRLKNLAAPDFGPLNRWRAPEPLVWGVITCGLFLLLGGGPFRIIGASGLIIFMTVYFFAGLAIVSYYFEHRRIPVPVRFILYSLIILTVQPILFFIVIGLGFFDIWLNFRKIDIKKINGG